MKEDVSRRRCSVPMGEVWLVIWGLTLGLSATQASGAEPQVVAQAHSAEAFQILRESNGVSGNADTLNKLYPQDVVEAGEKSVQVTLDRGAEIRIGQSASARIESDQKLTFLKGKALVAPMDDAAFEFNVSDVIVRQVASASEPGRPSILVLETNHPDLVRLDSLRGEWLLLDASGEQVIARLGEREGLDLARGETHERDLTVAGVTDSNSSRRATPAAGGGRSGQGWSTSRRALIFAGGTALTLGAGYATYELLDDDDDDDDDDSEQTSPVAP